jgi:hypothetical protein
VWGYVLFVPKEDDPEVYVYESVNVWGTSELDFTPQACPFEHALCEEHPGRVYMITKEAGDRFVKRYVAAAMAAGASRPYVRLVPGGVTFDGELCLVLRPFLFDGLEYLDLPGEDDA